MSNKINFLLVRPTPFLFLPIRFRDIVEEVNITIMLMFHMGVGCSIGEIAFATFTTIIPALRIFSFSTLLFFLLGALTLH